MAFKEERKCEIGLFESFLEQIENISVIVDKYMPADVRELYWDNDNGLNAYNMDYSLYGERLRERTILNIKYLIVLVGVSSESQYHLLQNVYFQHYKTQIIKDILEQVKLYVGKKFEDPDKKLTALELARLKKNPDKYFCGFQKYICSYLRTMYQAVSYVEKKSFLNDSEKYDYVKILRGQLSNEEELVLFYNSLSVLGQDWEYSLDGAKRKLITKYNMIKNIPDDKYGYLRSFYPGVKFEYHFQLFQILIIYDKIGRAFDLALPIQLAYCLFTGNGLILTRLFSTNMNTFKNIKVAVAGTGYVGLSIATLLSQHHHVSAVDVVPERQ